MKEGKEGEGKKKGEGRKEAKEGEAKKGEGRKMKEGRKVKEVKDGRRFVPCVPLCCRRVCRGRKDGRWKGRKVKDGR